MSALSAASRFPFLQAPVGPAGACLAALLLACGDGAGPPPTEDPLRFASIAVGTGTSCGLTAEGAAYCWGDGSIGQLGTVSALEQCDDVSCSTRPVRVESAGPLTSLTIGADFLFTGYACALDSSGLPHCWGRISVNEDGAYTFGPVPVPLPNGVALTSISAGRSHICGVAASHDAYCWGDFEGGRRGDPFIGLDTSSATFEPNIVGGDLDFAAVAAGTEGSCGLTLAGQPYCWGSNAFGALGDPAAPVQQNCGLAFPPCAVAPVPVAGGFQFTALSRSAEHVCGRTPVGEVFCWGSDRDEQIGADEPTGLCGQEPCAAAPTRAFAPERTFAAVSAGDGSTCGLDADSSAYCWGDNSFGQVGNGGGPAPVPVPVAGGLRYAAIAVSGDHACALSLEGEAFCWGENGSGQLGTGGRQDSNVPVAVVAPVAE